MHAPMSASYNCRPGSDTRKIIDLNFKPPRFHITLHFLLESLHIFSGVSSPGFGLLLGYPALINIGAAETVSRNSFVSLQPLISQRRLSEGTSKPFENGQGSACSPADTGALAPRSQQPPPAHGRSVPPYRHRNNEWRERLYPFAIAARSSVFALRYAARLLPRFTQVGCGSFRKWGGNKQE